MCVRLLLYEAGCKTRTANVSFSFDKQLPVLPTLYARVFTLLKINNNIIPQKARLSIFLTHFINFIEKIDYLC